MCFKERSDGGVGTSAFKASLLLLASRKCLPNISSNQNDLFFCFFYLIPLPTMRLTSLPLRSLTAAVCGHQQRGDQLMKMEGDNTADVTHTPTLAHSLN